MPRTTASRSTACIEAQRHSDAISFGDTIEQFHRLDAIALEKWWRALVGGPVPKNLGRPLTLRILAYRVQAQRFGDLDTASRRELSAIYDRLSRSVAAGAPDPSYAESIECLTSRPPAIGAASLRYARPGTLLKREYGGLVHRVMVLEEGVSWNGKTYESLSKVAFAITGTRWNGPRFFGLRDEHMGQRREAVNRNESPSQIIGRGRAAHVSRRLPS